jgi:hypothetical protein
MANTIFEYKIPEWRYKPARIHNPDLEKVQQELYAAIVKYSGKTEEELPPIYVILDINFIFSECPTVHSILKEMNIDHLVTHTFFTCLNIQEPDQVIHVDTIKDIRYCAILSMPVLNCENSYTGFYDAPVLRHKLMPENYRLCPAARAAVPVDASKAVEIDRSDTMTISWLNTEVPHRGVRLDKTRTRIMASFRFKPNILEELATGRLFHES